LGQPLAQYMRDQAVDYCWSKEEVLEKLDF
jgi:hypothetical protein